ncbi:hypothetical protein [Brevundimonas sp. DWR2-3-1b1]|uniref:hypothetical protein n=1 Tax=unclassified Brevundimonas TaxID=2622653 RepID=UPI003CFB59E9
MEADMLAATQHAAAAAVSSANAAWWALALNGVAAFAAVGALWYAVLQGAKAAVFERRKIGSVCYNIGSELEVVSGSYSGEIGDKEAEAANAKHLTESGALRRARAHLLAANNVVIPDPKAQEEIGYMIMILDFIEADIAAGNDGQDYLSDVDAATTIFARLGYKYLGQLHPYPNLRHKYFVNAESVNDEVPTPAAALQTEQTGGK